MAEELIILGTGGHARALRSLYEGRGYYPIWLQEYNDPPKMNDRVAIGIGDLAIRKILYTRYAPHIIDRGVQEMRGVIRCPTALIGENVLLNTGCQIDHDCVISNHCIISPGAILCGGVFLGLDCQIGAGAIILQGVHLDAGTKIPAGALVVGPDDIRRPQRLLPDGTFPYR